MLRNAVLNSAIPNSLKDDIQAIFLKWIDEFTVSHIRLLRMLHYINNYNYEQFLANLPDLEKNRDFYNQILLELSGKGLIKLSENYVVIDPVAIKKVEDIDKIIKSKESRTTDLGKQFIQFIENPLV
ncbi:MAG: hypothetical protein F6K24_26240 [Okeania sp. SIO2D1]|nr:hypothetical protein [Okeania sp. SIO2D1]